jgi:hypothetical protein
VSGMVSLPIEVWAKMEDRLFWLQCLEDAGVDNWGGIDYAYKLYHEEVPE